jgi:hypothetical protein
MASSAHAWNHPGHMTSAAITFSEIEKIGLLFLAHPDTAPFWVAAGEAKGKWSMDPDLDTALCHFVDNPYLKALLFDVFLLQSAVYSDSIAISFGEKTANYIS